MESVIQFVTDNGVLIAATATVAIFPALYLLKRSFLSVRRAPARPKPGPPNTVVLYQIHRGPHAPSMSPFPLKLETYLRLANIPYENDFTGVFSHKGKTPWMTYNEDAVADSQFCIEYLNKKLNINLNSKLSKEDLAMAHALRVLVEDHLYWVLCYYRWVVHTNTEVMKTAFPSYPIRMAAKQMLTSQLHAQGTGRHKPEEIYQMLLADLQTLSDFLGDKQFMMGSVPSEVDCSIFGMLVQALWHTKGVALLENLIPEKFPNLNQYCIRMKEKAWPDWDKCHTHGGTRQAEK